MKTYKVTLFENGLRWHVVGGVLPSGVKIWIDKFVKSNKFDQIKIEQIKIKKELKL